MYASVSARSCVPRSPRVGGSNLRSASRGEKRESVPTFRVDSASGGDPSIREYPFVFLRLEPGGLHDLERLLTALEMANHATRRRWVVECALQRGLLFILRPRFWKAVAEITTLDITDARHDLGVLAATLEKNVGAAWWTKR